MCFKQVISTLSGKPLKLADQFTYLGSNISSIERDAFRESLKCYWLVIDHGHGMRPKRPARRDGW